MEKILSKKEKSNKCVEINNTTKNVSVVSKHTELLYPNVNPEIKEELQKKSLQYEYNRLQEYNKKFRPEHYEGWDEKQRLAQLILYKMNESFKLEYWCKMPRWNSVQAIALVNNYNPTNLRSQSWNIVQKAYHNVFLPEFTNDLNLLERCILHNEISHVVQKNFLEANDFYFSPISFVEWAKIKDINLPKGFEEAVYKYHPEWIDWQSKYNEAQEEIEKLKNTLLIVPKQLSYVATTNVTNYECPDLNGSVHKNPEEEFLSKKRASVYDKIIASLAILKFRVLEDLNGSHIDSLTQKNIEKFAHGFKPLDRKTLTLYLKAPRELLKLESTAQKKLHE